MSTDRYTSPLSERYASKEMQYIFSQDMKFTTWRKLWIALAETEMELGLSENGKPVITQEQIDELKAHVNDINYDVICRNCRLLQLLRAWHLPGVYRGNYIRYNDAFFIAVGQSYKYVECLNRHGSDSCFDNDFGRQADGYSGYAA